MSFFVMTASRDTTQRAPKGFEAAVRAAHLDPAKCVAFSMNLGWDGVGIDVCLGKSSEVHVLSSGKPRYRSTDSSPDEVAEPISSAELATRWRASGPSLLSQLSGSWALAVVDTGSEEAHLCVDAFGTMSLFYRITDEGIAVSTEVAPLLMMGQRTSLDREALPDVFSLRFLPAGRTVWKDIRQVPAGRLLTLSRKGIETSDSAPRFCYDAHKVERPLESAAKVLHSAVAGHLGRLHDEGVRDVAIPLSGGIDSSVLAAIAVRTFPRCIAVTVEMTDFDNPELALSKAVSDRLGLPLKIAWVTEKCVRESYPWILARIQEPPRHFNNVAVLRMLETVRDLADVVLAGDAATIFGFGDLPTVQRLVHRSRLAHTFPARSRTVLSWLLRKSRLPRAARAGLFFDHDLPALIQRLTLLKRTPEAHAAIGHVAGNGWPSTETVSYAYDFFANTYEASHLWELRTLVGATIRRNLRLGVGLGVRYEYPLLSAPALALAASLPPSLRWDEERDVVKPILGAVCADLVGPDVAGWPKIGFPTPELSWMLGPLSERLRQALGSGSMLLEWFDPSALRGLDPGPNLQTLWTLMGLEEVLVQSAQMRGE